MSSGGGCPENNGRKSADSFLHTERPSGGVEKTNVFFIEMTWVRFSLFLFMVPHFLRKFT